MSKVSLIKDVIFGVRLYGKKTKTSLLIASALALTPLIIDSMLTDDSFQCPSSNRRFYSALLLLGPSICVTLLGLSHSIKYFREHENRGMKTLWKRLFSRVLTIVVLMCVTIGSSFVLSEHYVCFSTVLEDYRTANRINLMSQSRQIGWLIIMSSLFLLLCIAMIELMFYKKGHFEKCIKTYLSCQRREAEKLLEDSLSRLSAKIVNRRLNQASERLNKMSDHEDDSFKAVLTLFRAEKAKILNSGKNFMPTKLSLRQKMHFFSLSLDEDLDQN